MPAGVKAMSAEVKTLPAVGKPAAFDEEAELSRQLASTPEARPSRDRTGEYPDAPPEAQPLKVRRQQQDISQWQVGPNGIFRPAARTIPALEAGAYTVEADDRGAFLRHQSLLCDTIVELPDSANARVLAGIRKFWTRRARYIRHGLVFKRGVLLYGPPGAGKTVTIHLLVRDLIEKGGVVIFCSHPTVTQILMGAVRAIEPRRPIILVLEDIDEIIEKFGEHEILSMLDGEHQTDNVVYVATTNYPGKLGARIVNRPSRFDDRVFVGMPSESARLTYLLKAAAGEDEKVLRMWAKESGGLSIAHLRELVAAVLCLDQEYGDVLKRLQSMNERPKEVDGFRDRSPGFRDSPGF